MESRRTVAPGPGKGAQTRARIVAVAAEAFARDGFDALSLRDLAGRAGLTHAGLKHHFATKEALLLEVLDERDRSDSEAFALWPHRRSGREVLRWAVEIVSRNTTQPGTASLYARLSGEAGDRHHPAHPHFFQRYRRLVAIIEAAFQEEAAQLPAHLAPRTAARQFVALMDGLQVQWLLDPDDVDMVAQLTAYLAGIGISIDDTKDRTTEEAPAR